MTTEQLSPRSVLVVVPTLNEAATIQPVIGALTEDLPDRLKVTLVVADGGSKDGTVEIVKSLMPTNPFVKIVDNAKRFQSAGVNLAVQTHGQKAEILVRCDAHSVYPPAFIERLIDTLDRVHADAVVVPMHSVGENCLQRAVAWVSDTLVGSGGSAHRGGRRSGFIDHGHHAAFRLHSFLRAGRYDESFTHNEDAELDCRQRAFGSRIYLDAEIGIGYSPRKTFKALAKQYFQYGRGRSRTLRRHPSSMRVRQLALPANLVVMVIALASAAWVPFVLMWPLFYALVLSATSIALAVRHKSWCALLAGPAAATMHTSWSIGFVAGLLLIREQRWRPERLGASTTSSNAAASATSM